MRKRLGVVLLSVCVFACVCALWSRRESARAQDQDLLPIIRAGCSNAVASVKSGKGNVTTHQWSIKPEGGVIETEAAYAVVFAGSKYKVSRETTYLKNEAGASSQKQSRLVQAGSKLAMQIAYDGEKVVTFDPLLSRAVIGSPETHEVIPMHGEYTRGVQLVGHGLLDIDKLGEATGQGEGPGKTYIRDVVYDGEKTVVLAPGDNSAIISDPSLPAGNSQLVTYKADISVLYHGLNDFLTQPSQKPSFVTAFTGPTLVGHEVIDGDDCTILEYTETIDIEGVRRTTTSRIWINPSKGYTMPRVRKWMQGGTFSNKTLVAEIDAKVKDYGDGVYGPSMEVKRVYDVDATGTVYKSKERVITYDPAFRLNVPISPDTFVVKLPAGTKVNDQVTDMEYTVP